MKIVSVASAIPDTSINNDAIETRLGLNPGWIERRTGILRRPTALPSEATSDLAVRAGAAAIEKAGIEKKEVGLLLLATSTPDHLLPPTAPLVAHRLGLQHAGAIDLTGACAGFLYGLVLGGGYLRTTPRAVLLIGANILTRRVNQQDPGTVALFSDGAGAIMLAPNEPSQLLGFYLGSDGSFYDAMGIPAGGSREPLSHDGLDEGKHLMTIRRGSAVFKQAVHGMAFAGRESLKMARLDPPAVDWWIPHQANSRVMKDAGSLLEIPPERTINVVDRYGNSSAATIPVALAHGVESNQVREGNILLLTAVGAGIVSAGAVVRWSG